MYSAFQDKGLVVLGVSVDRLGPHEMQQFLRQHQVRYPVAMDLRYSVARMYGVQGTPTSYLINRAGKVVGGIAGPGAWDSDVAQKLITQLLDQTP